MMKSTLLPKSTLLTLLATLCLYAGTYSNSKTVTSAGTPVALSSTSTCVTTLAVTALIGNTGVIYVGGSAVRASTKTGIPLTAGTTYTFPPMASNCAYNLNLLYIDSTASSDAASFTYTRN